MKPEPPVISHVFDKIAPLSRIRFGLLQGRGFHRLLHCHLAAQQPCRGERIKIPAKVARQPLDHTEAALTPPSSYHCDGASPTRQPSRWHLTSSSMLKQNPYVDSILMLSITRREKSLRPFVASWVGNRAR